MRANDKPGRTEQICARLPEALVRRVDEARMAGGALRREHDCYTRTDVVEFALRKLLKD